MYRIDKNSNNVVKLEQRLFKDLRIREREHLQEWIAKNPEMLGEDLLIIQKEYDGFNDTKERLDLLALDKEGGIVVIENKLDDTGRDVVWQAIKYASYCSTLTTSQIFRIYQEYLDKNDIKEIAKDNILEFLQGEEDTLVLNEQDQRIIFVANEYRKEVTSTALWLLAHDIKLQCFKATPYSMDNDIFLQVEQIIPLPETEQFVIDAKKKEKENREYGGRSKEKKEHLKRFWNLLKTNFNEHNCKFIESVNAGPYDNLSFKSGKGRYFFRLGRKAYRVELSIAVDDERKYINAMRQYEDIITNRCGGNVIFEITENVKATRIKYELSENHPINQLKFNNEENWDELADWFRISMITLFEAVNPHWEKVQKELNK